MNTSINHGSFTTAFTAANEHIKECNDNLADRAI